MEKLTDNFYLLTRQGKRWNKTQTQILKENCHYEMFKPIPKDYVDYVLYGCFDNVTGLCEYKAPDIVMLNYDVCNGKKCSLRGLICISFDGKYKIRKRGKEYKYYYCDLIGNNSLNKTIASSIKNKNSVVIKSGKDMIDYWINYGKKNKFDYFKLRSMEDVIGFYWKCGFRFNYIKKKYNVYDTEKWSSLIKKLNDYNKLLKRRQDGVREKEKKEFGLFLEKHFNKFMEGYYNIDYLSNEMYRDSMKYNNTLSENKYNLRFQGYSMYYHF